MSADRPGLHIGYCGDPGRRRELNEDSFLILTAPAITPEIDALLAVADGMGGHQAGDVASRLLVEMLDRLFTSSAYQRYVAYSPQHPDYYVVVLKEVLEQANERLYTLAAGRPQLSGMGTTATVVLLAGWRLFWGHVGDSRAYLLHNGSLRRLTRDHTWVNEQVERGWMTAKEASRHPRRNVLTQSLGNSLLVRIERGVQPVQPGDLLLLCSDGLSGVVSDAEIRGVLLTTRDPQAACEQLVVLANQRGGPDNITVVAARLITSGSGSNIASGRVVGPVERGVLTQPLVDTLKLRRGQRRWRVENLKPLAYWIGVALVLLLGAVISGLGALLVPLIPLPAGLLAVAPVVVVTFALGALVGWLVRPDSLK